MRLDLTGRGRSLLAAILAFGRATCSARRSAATVAAFNQRALALCRLAGFEEVHRFVSAGDAPRRFVILLRRPA